MFVNLDYWFEHFPFINKSKNSDFCDLRFFAISILSLFIAKKSETEVKKSQNNNRPSKLRSLTDGEAE